MLGKLRKFRNAVLREAGLLGVYLSMTRDEVRAVLTARPPLPVTWEDSLVELQALV